jgi:hypothetical protein
MTLGGTPQTVGNRLIIRRSQVRGLQGPPKPASLASSAALPAHRTTAIPGPTRGGDPYVNGYVNPYVNGYVNPYVIVYALGVRTPCVGGPRRVRWKATMLPFTSRPSWP